MIRGILPKPNAFDYLCSSDQGGSGGDDGGNGGGGDGGGGNEGGDGGGAPAKTFTQADLDRAAGARAAEAKRKAEKDIADALGVSVEEAKQIIADRRTADDQDKSDAQKAKDAADRAKAEADTAKADAQRERMSARIERALMREKVRDDRLDSSIKLLEVAPDATDEEVTAAVVAFKESTPEFFGEADPDNGGKGGGGNLPPGDPKGKPVPKKSEDAYARGLERAKAKAGSGTYPALGNAN